LLTLAFACNPADKTTLKLLCIAIALQDYMAVAQGHLFSTPYCVSWLAKYSARVSTLAY
jgi:hypothetical protein